jgi:ankyrin repeat protein
MLILDAAEAGDLAEVQRLVGQDASLLNARGPHLARTPLMVASQGGHMGVVCLLLDKGAAINERDAGGCTALWYACCDGRPSVVRLLLERGADPTIATGWGSTPLIEASSQGHLKVVRSLLGHPSARATINRRDINGRTALWWACYKGSAGVVRALLESGADATIASNAGTTPMAIAKHGVTAEGCRECVAALEVRLIKLSTYQLISCA